MYHGIALLEVTPKDFINKNSNYTLPKEKGKNEKQKRHR